MQHILPETARGGPVVLRPVKTIPRFSSACFL